jgi:hypothetical protein
MVSAVKRKRAAAISLGEFTERGSQDFTIPKFDTGSVRAVPAFVINRKAGPPVMFSRV